jgi:hypothetical protein
VNEFFTALLAARTTPDLSVAFRISTNIDVRYAITFALRFWGGAAPSDA